jgi:ankyrin repeat protein
MIKSEHKMKTGNITDFVGYTIVSLLIILIPIAGYSKDQITPLPAVDRNGNTELHNASHDGKLKVVNDLIKMGADINTKNHLDMTALEFASYKGHLEIVKVLVANDANVNNINALGFTAFMLSAQNGHLDICRMLIKAGAKVDVHDRGTTPLHLASIHGNTETVNLLIDEGANINARNHKGITALQLASLNGNIEIVKLLIKRGADINLSDNKDNAALEMALSPLVSRERPIYEMESKKRFMNVAKELIENGANANDNAVKLLIKLLKSESFIGFSPLDALIKIGLPAIINELKKGGLQKENSFSARGTKYEAIRILGEIGDPRAIPVLADALMEWEEGRFALAYLKTFNFTPTTIKEKVYLQVALRDKEALLEDWVQSREILINELASSNKKKMVAAIYTLIATSKKEVIPELVNVLSEKGNLNMANTYLNSGDQRLSDAAKQWVAKHGYQVTTQYGGGGGGEVRWGEF